MPFVRSQSATLARRLAEPRRLIQVVAGPRQVGKTTLVQQVREPQYAAGRRGLSSCGFGVRLVQVWLRPGLACASHRRAPGIILRQRWVAGRYTGLSNSC